MSIIPSVWCGPGVRSSDGLVISLGAILFSGAAPGAVDVEAFDSNIQRPGASTRDLKVSSCISQRNLTGSARAGA
jgi:hypothetical protein